MPKSGSGALQLQKIKLHICVKKFCSDECHKIDANLPVLQGVYPTSSAQKNKPA